MDKVLVLKYGQLHREKAVFMPLKEAISISPMANGKLFEPVIKPGTKAGTAIVIGNLSGNTSGQRDKSKDFMSDLAAIDVDVHVADGDPEIDHAKMWEAAKKLGFIAYQPSNSGTGLHFLCEIKGRGKAFNEALAENVNNHTKASAVFNQIYIDFINEITLPLLDGQSDKVKEYYLKRGVKTGNHGQRYGLCDPELKSVNRLVYLTKYSWKFNENHRPFEFSTKNTEQRMASAVGRLTAQGYTAEETTAIVAATVPDFKPDNAARLIAKNKSNPRWQGFKCLDVFESLDAAIQGGLAKIRDCFEIGKIGGKVFIRRKGTTTDPDDLKDCHDLKAPLFYRDGDKVKQITLKAILDSADGINYINQFPTIIATYEKQIEGGINLCPPLPKYEYSITENSVFIADYLYEKSPCWAYGAKALARAIERPNDAVQAVLYLYEPEGGKGKSTTMEHIIAKLGLFISEVTLNANNKYSNDMPKSKIWYMAEGAFNAENTEILSNIKKWSGDKSFSLDIKYGSIAKCQNCPLLIITCNEIERIPIKLLNDRRTIPIKYCDTGERYKELKRRSSTFTPSDVYSGLIQLANRCEKDFKVGSVEYIPPLLMEASKAAVERNLCFSRIGMDVIAGKPPLEICRDNRCTIGTVLYYQELAAKFGLIDKAALKWIFSDEFLGPVSKMDPENARRFKEQCEDFFRFNAPESLF